MRMLARLLSTSSLALVILIAPAIAQITQAQENNLESIDNNTLETDADSLTFSPRFDVQFNSEGAGTNEYFGFGGWVPLFQKPGDNILFVEGRLLWDIEDSTVGSNVLLGYRDYNPKSNRILGGYISYDNRDTGNNFYNQIGLGVESLGEIWDVLFNAYIPVGDTSETLSESISNPFFEGNSVLLERRRRVESAFTGVDLEIGKQLVTLGQTGELRGYAGIYYYNAFEGDDDVVGGRLRLAARINDYSALGLTLQYDEIFDTRLIANVRLNFPGSGLRRKKDRPTVLSRLGSAVQRINSITIDQETREDEVTALDPDTGEALEVIHVDLGLGNSDGSFEDPFGTLEEALEIATSGNIIYVRSGTNPGIDSFTVADGISVLSSGPEQFIETDRGIVQLPESGSQILPDVLDTVFVGSDTILSGFNISTANSSGIQGNNITGTVLITDNIITGTLATVEPGIVISNETDTLNLTIARNTIADYGATGIRTSVTGSGVLNAEILDNTLIGNQGGISSAMRETSQLNAIINGNDIIGNLGLINDDGSGFTVGEDPKSGIRQESFGNSQGTITISNNLVINHFSNGISFGNRDDAQLTAIIENNFVSNNLGNGIFFGATVNANVQGEIIGNTVSDHFINPTFGTVPSGNGIFGGSQVNAQMIVSITNNEITDNEVSGINFGVFDNAQGTADISDNTLLNNNTTNDSQGSAIGITTGLPTEFGDGSTTSQVFATVINNSIDGLGNAAYAIGLTAINNAQVDITVNDNEITNTNGGIQLLSTGANIPTIPGTLPGTASDVTATIDNNFIEGGDIYAISLLGIPAAQGSGGLNAILRDLTITNNTLTNTGPGGGIDLFNVLGDNLIANNTISDSRGIPDINEPDVLAPNPDNPDELFPQRPSCGLGAPQNGCNTNEPFNSDLFGIQEPLSGTGRTGIRIFNVTGSTTFTIEENEVSDSSSNGIFVGSGGNSEVTVDVLSNNSSDNRGSGIFTFAVQGGQLTANIADNTANNNQGRIFNESGIRLATFDGATAIGTITGNTTNNNIGQGIFIGANDGSIISGNDNGRVLVEGNVANNNTGQGIFLGSREGAEASATIINNTANDNNFNPDVIPETFPTGSGIAVAAQEGGLAVGLVTDNIANNNERFGTVVFALDGSTVFATVDSNQFAGNEGSPGGMTPPLPFDFSAQKPSPASRLCVSLQNNTSETGFSLVPFTLSVAPEAIFQTNVVPPNTDGNIGPITIVPVGPPGMPVLTNLSDDPSCEDLVP